MTIVPPLNIDKLDYADRKFITILEDHIVDKHRKKEKSEQGTKKTIFPWALAGSGFAGAILAMPVVPGMAISLGVSQLIWHLIDSVRKAGVNILEIGRSEAKQLLFPPTHPQNGLVYAGHPLSPKKYYPLAEFHRSLLNDKFLEVIKLLGALGAHEINVEADCSSGCDFFGGINMESLFGLRSGVHKKNKTNFSWKSRSSGHANPFIPGDLVWYEHEGQWKQLANDRIYGGLKDAELKIAYEKDYEINAELVAVIEKIGFKAGGEFRNFEKSIWDIKAEF